MKVRTTITLGFDRRREAWGLLKVAASLLWHGSAWMQTRGHVDTDALRHEAAMLEVART